MSNNNMYKYISREGSTDRFLVKLIKEDPNVPWRDYSYKNDSAECSRCHLDKVPHMIIEDDFDYYFICRQCAGKILCVIYGGDGK